MSTYCLSTRTLNAVTNQACWEIYTPSTLAIKIFEIGVSNIAATATAVGLAKPTIAGVGRVSPVGFIAEQDSGLPTSKTLSAVAWTTAPTVSIIGYYRRAAILGAVGAGVLWTFPKGLYVPPSTSMCIFNLAASGTFDCWAIIDE